MTRTRTRSQQPMAPRSPIGGRLSKSVPVPTRPSGLTSGLTTRLTTDHALVWGVRLIWAALALLLAPAIGQALDDHSRAVQVTGTVGAWAVWFVVLVAMLLPSTISLTIVRMVAPGTVLVTLAAGVAGASVTAFIVGLASSVVVTLLTFSGEIGQRFVRGSAYGDETRLPLRPPGPLLLGPIPLLWLATAVAVMVGPLLVAARAWLLGAAVTLFAIGLGVFAGTRLHRLARRWLVFVPAGLVIHDELVLAATVTLPRPSIDAIVLAPADTEAADLTGNALGRALEIRLTGASTVVLAGSPSKPGGTALHVHSILVSPTRPGRVIAEAARRRVAG
jgi:hypothetical protein